MCQKVIFLFFSPNQVFNLARFRFRKEKKIYQKIIADNLSSFSALHTLILIFFFFPMLVFRFQFYFRSAVMSITKLIDNFPREVAGDNWKGALITLSKIFGRDIRNCWQPDAHRSYHQFTLIITSRAGKKARNIASLRWINEQMHVNREGDIHHIYYFQCQTESLTLAVAAATLSRASSRLTISFTQNFSSLLLAPIRPWLS